MLNEIERRRLEVLRTLEDTGSLSQPEQSELSLMLQRLDEAEAAQLAPATTQLRRERKNMEAQNQSLQALVRRQEALAARLQALLDEARVERRAIAEEQARILGDGNGTSRASVEAGAVR